MGTEDKVLSRERVDKAVSIDQVDDVDKTLG